MKRLLVPLLSGVLFVAAPVAVAPAQTGDSEQNQSEDSDFPYGLLGLLGLAGLAGLKRRDDNDHRRTTTTHGTTSGRT